MSVAIASDVSNSCCHSLSTKQLHQAHKEPDASADVYADCPNKVLLVTHSLTSQHVCISQTKVEPHIGIIVYTLISAGDVDRTLLCSVSCRQIVNVVTLQHPTDTAATMGLTWLVHERICLCHA